MPFVDVEGSRLYFRADGHEDGPVLLLSHSLGADHGMWDPQMPDLTRYFRVVRYDARGHGASDAPPGDYTIERLSRDALAVADACGAAAFAFCGLSLGGMVGQWLAAHAAGRLTSVVLANTSPRFPDPSVMETRRRTVLDQGMTGVVDAVLQRFFSLAAERREPMVSSVRRAVLGTDPVGYAGCCAAIRDMDQTPSLREIRVPALIIASSEDASTPWAGHGEVLAREIRHARIARLAGAHLSNIERPRGFTAALLEFLLPEGANGDLETGFAMRRSVLGDAHVNRARALTTDFTRDFQELITRYAWGAIWTRPALDPRTRRLLVLTAMASLGRWEEFRLHVRSGLAQELEESDLKEILLQAAAYAGVPAANAAFRVAEEELAARNAKGAGELGQR